MSDYVHPVVEQVAIDNRLSDVPEYLLALPMDDVPKALF
jgi:hypothetical protein